MITTRDQRLLGCFLSVYVNHRPAFGLSPFDLHEGFTKLGTPGDEGFAIDRNRLLTLLQNKGMIKGSLQTEIENCLLLLMLVDVESFCLYFKILFKSFRFL